MLCAERKRCLAGRLEPLHLPLLPPRRPVGVLGPVVEVAALPVLHVGHHVAVCDAVAAQAVGDDATRLILQLAE